jgi:hypothetical protein
VGLEQWHSSRSSYSTVTKGGLQMNERILELADKAVEDMPSGPWNIPDEFCKKFAELIVREFSKQVQIEGRFGLEREQTLIRLCCENAKKHFGVEE